MEIGLVTNCFVDKTWEDVCRISSENNINILEVAAGGLCGKNVCDPNKLVSDNFEFNKFKKTAKKYNIKIKEFTCIGNFLHPQKQIADEYIKDMEAVIELASKLDVNIINTLAGLPGAAEDAKYPNFIALPYPPEFNDYVKWQWEERIIPFWKKMTGRARKYNIKFGFEILAGDSIFNPSALMRLREEVGAEEISCKFDPTHLWWQGIDPIIALKYLKDLIISVHAQDCGINKEVVSLNGFLDFRDYSFLNERPWIFKLVGYGHSEEFWKKFIGNLRLIGYDGSINIEHLDAIISVNEGIKKGYEFLKNIIFFEKQEGVRF